MSASTTMVDVSLLLLLFLVRKNIWKIETQKQNKNYLRLIAKHKFVFMFEVKSVSWPNFKMFCILVFYICSRYTLYLEDLHFLALTTSLFSALTTINLFSIDHIIIFSINHIIVFSITSLDHIIVSACSSVSAILALR